ncbi:MAG: hypothetical protein COA42_17115 [Alteromonadaceae bacterium]|nr:MAG: hypothetical protein COA42_17115 [Alteromonadaceae bacterium]
MANVEKLVEYIELEMTKNSKSSAANQIREKNSETLGLYDAMVLWKSKVGNRKPWDHKGHIKNTYGEWASDSETSTQYNYDIWSNLHYGYVGRHVGFSEWLLKAGAGYAQLSAGTSPSGYWGRRFSKLGDADFLAAFDDPKDLAAIDIGSKLWVNNKSNITANKILRAIRSRRKELQIK